MRTRLAFISIIISFFMLHAVAGSFKTIDETQLKTFMKDKSYVVLDVRTAAEIAETGIIPGAKIKNFHDFDFGAYIKKLDKSKKYIIYCHSGGRSANVAYKMVDLGYEALNYGGGITGWLRGKNKTVKKSK